MRTRRRPFPPAALAPLLLAAGCSAAKPQPASTAQVHAKSSAYSLVMQATSCWMGGLWSDALGESNDERYAGINRRCNALLRDVDITAPERSRAVADRVPPPAPEEAYYPMRAVEPAIVDAIAREVQARAEKEASEAPQAAQLVSLLRAVADVARETVQARRSADVVKKDVSQEAPVSQRTSDKEAAGPRVSSSDALVALLHLDAGQFTTEASAIAVLSALDRMEIARGLPKHLKMDAVGGAYAGVFGVSPPPVAADAALPIRTGTWLTYLTDVAAAAGHAVPAAAHDPQNREPLAWTGVLEGFADKLRADGARFPSGTPLGDVERGVVARLDKEFRAEREVYEAHAPANR